MNLGKFSVGNPVLINILMVVVLVLGFGALQRLPQEQFPEVPLYFIFISVPYPGVAADDIERTITIKIEQEMQNIKKLDELFSFTRDGVSVVQLDFEDSVTQDEFDKLLQDVRTRFNNIDLPDGVGQEIIDDFSSTDFLPVIQINLYGDISYPELEESAEIISDRIKLITGVNDVSTVGKRTKEIVVEANRTELEARRIGIEQLAGAINSSNISIPGGKLASNTREYILRTDKLVKDSEDLKRIAVRNTTGGITYVGDIAEVRVEYDEDEGGFARYNGFPSIVLRVNKVPGANSVAMIDEIKQIMEESSSLLSAGLNYSYFNDTSIEIQDNIRVLGGNIFFGFILVIGVLFLFLGIRNSLLTALGIPVSFAATFIVLVITGETLNENVLFALVLVIGLLVDHAIVITENCYRLRLQGNSLHHSAINGVNQVLRPVVAATATTVAVFLPLTFLPGIIGRFLRVVPITVSIALLASTLEALVILPSHFADWTSKKGLKKRSEHRFNKFRELFGRTLGFIYRHRVVSLTIFLIVLIGSFALLGLVSQDLFANYAYSYFFVDIYTPVGTPLAKTEAVVKEYEARLLPLLAGTDLVSITSFSGFVGEEQRDLNRSDVGQLLVDLVDVKEGGRPPETVIEEARQLTADIVGIERVRFRFQEGGPPTDEPVAFRLHGDSYEDLETISNAIQERLANFQQLVDIRDNLESGKPELRLVVNEANAARYGLTVGQIGSFIRNSFEGVEAGVLFGENEETDIIVRYATPAIESPDQLLGFRIQNNFGQQVPLSSIVSIRTEETINQITRNNGKREVTIESGATNTENLSVIDRDIEHFFADELQTRFPTVSLQTGGQFAEFTNIFFDILLVMSAGIFLVYVILGAQFKSYLQPFIILLSVPFSFLGVTLYLIASGTAVTVIVVYAAVALAGIAVNDAIVLISFVNDLRASGTEVRVAVLQAAKTRLRPIILTSLTTIAGLLPMSLGIGGYSATWGPMSNTIIFGLILSTAGTLIIVPCIYGLIFDKSNRHKRRDSRREHRTTSIAHKSTPA